MPQVDSFTVTSIDHNEVLLGDSVKSTRNLLGTESLEDTPLKLNFEFTIGEKTFSHELTREKGVFTEGSKLKLGGDDGEVVEVDMPKIYSYFSEDRKVLLNFHSHDKVQGILNTDNQMLHFTTEEGNLLVSHNPNPVPEGLKQNLRRKLEEGEIKNSNIEYWDNCHGLQPSTAVLNTGAAVGYMMYSKYGTSGALSMINGYISESNTIYTPQMNVRLEVDDQFVATSPNAGTWTASSCSMSIQTQLNNFRSWKKPSNQDIWHLYDDCFGVYNTVLGIAYVGTLCSSSSNVGVDYVSRNINLNDYPTWGTVAHELGHNFNAQHSFEQGQGSTGGIMDYGPHEDKFINGVAQFNTYWRKAEVCSEIAWAVNTGCMTQTLEPAGNEITERRVEAVRDLNCEKHAHRLIGGVNPLSTTRVGVTLGQCKAQCEDDTACSGFTWGKKGHCETWSDKHAEDMFFSPQFDTYFCAEDVVRGVDAEKTVDDLLERINVDNVSDLCCEVVENAHMSGVNAWYDEPISKAKCFKNCLTTSECEAASWDIVDEHCMYYGKPFPEEGYTGEHYYLPGAQTLKCNRACVNNRALGAESSDSGAIVMGLGVVGALMGVAAVGGAIYTYFGKSSKKEEECNN